MFVKVQADIYVEVKDPEQAESAAALIDSSGADVLGPNFPHGEIAKVDVPGGYSEVSDEEAEEKGLTE